MENEKSNYSECSAFIRKFTDPSTLNTRFSESKRLVEKAVSGDEVDSRIDLDDCEALHAPKFVEKPVETKVVVSKPAVSTPVVAQNTSDADTKKNTESKKQAEDNTNGADTSYLHLVIKSEGQSTKAKEKASKTAHVIGLIFTYAFLVVMAVLFLFPF